MLAGGQPCIFILLFLALCPLFGRVLLTPFSSLLFSWTVYISAGRLQLSFSWEANPWEANPWEANSWGVDRMQW